MPFRTVMLNLAITAVLVLVIVLGGMLLQGLRSQTVPKALKVPVAGVPGMTTPDEGGVPKESYEITIGEPDIKRAGKDITIVSYSIGVGVSLEAAETLAGEGIDAEVIDLRTIRPLDRETVIESLRKTHRLMVVEEGWPTCSIASEITAIVMEEGFDDLDAPVLRVTNVDVPLPYAANLEKLALLKVEDVVEAAKKVCYR